MTDTVILYYGPLVSLQDARLASSSRYFTGQPCRGGHVAQRMVSNRSCCKCLEVKTARRHENNVEHRKTLRNNRRKSNVEAARTKSRAHYAKHAAEYAKHMREYRKTNPDRVKASKKKTYKKTYDKIIARNRNRRAREREAEGSFSANDLNRIRAAQRDRCAACRCHLNGSGHADHIIALVKGGSNWPANIQLLCPRCNTRKKDKDPIAFMQEMGYLL